MQACVNVQASAILGLGGASHALNNDDEEDEV
jgi:hypothetical protein